MYIVVILNMEYLAIVLGLILLIKGGDWILEGAVLFSLRLNIPKIIVGMTVVSFATSAPELIVSINAALNGYPDQQLEISLVQILLTLLWF